MEAFKHHRVGTLNNYPCANSLFKIHNIIIKSRNQEDSFSDYKNYKIL